MGLHPKVTRIQGFSFKTGDRTKPGGLERKFDKKRGLMIRNSGELGTFRGLIKEEGLGDLMATMVEVNPEKGKKKRPEEEEDVIQI